MLLSRYCSIFLLLCASAFAQELKRPGTDVDGGAISTLGCVGVHVGSTAMPLSRDGAGLATFSMSSTAGTSTQGRYSDRIFSSFTKPGIVYSTLSLNVNSSATGWLNQGDGRRGYAALSYSLDMGVTWTLIRSDSSGAGWAQSTNTIALSPTLDFSLLRVAVCTGGASGSKFQAAGSDPLQVYDVWTVAGGGSSQAGSGSGAGQPHRGIVVVN